MQELQTFEDNTDEINQALKTATQQWKLFDNALNNEKQPIPLIIARNSEQLLVNMNRITGLYAQIK